MAFLIDIFAGMLIAFCYDFFRTLRHTVQNKAVQIISDILFWILTGCITLTALFYNSDIQLRAYEFFGILTGLFFYFSVLSSLLQPVHKMITNIFHFFSKTLFTIGNFFGIILKTGYLFLTFPFRFFAKWLHCFAARRKTAFQKQKKLLKRI